MISIFVSLPTNNLPAIPVPPLPPELEFRIGSRLERGWGDPLAQSFLCEASGGMMLTSIDLFFKTKSVLKQIELHLHLQ